MRKVEKPIHIMHLNLGDWEGGVAGFTPEQEGFYFRLCRRLYAVGGQLANDDSRNAKRLGIDIRVYQRLKAFLITESKIEIADGYINQRRVLRDLAEIDARRETASEHGRTASTARKKKALREAENSPVASKNIGESPSSSPEVGPKSAGSRAEVPDTKMEKPCDFNTATMPSPSPPPISTPLPPSNGGSEATERPGRKGRVTPSITAPERRTAAAAVDDFNQAAAALGFARCGTLTDKRASALARRLADVGQGDLDVGAQRFRDALTAIPHWRFLAGREKPRPGQAAFRLDLERLLSTGSGMGDVLAKLCDLFDEHGPHATATGQQAHAAVNQDRVAAVWRQAQAEELAAQRARSEGRSDVLH